MYTTLISVKELATSVDDPHWLIVDCRFDLADATAGERAYGAAHVPNAVYAHLDRDLAAPIDSQTGRHPLPQPESFAATLGRWGLTPDTQVVAYDADSGAFAARLWWLLRWAGHRAVAVLDGGFKAWKRSGGALSTDMPQRHATTFAFEPNSALSLTTAEVAERVQRADWRLLDARAPERFAGTVEPIDRVAGHVPGAHNHPFAMSLDTNAQFLPAAELRSRITQSQRNVRDAHTVVMCGSGVTACHLLLAMEHAGKRGARLYPGSWSEWITDPQRPVARD